MPNKISSLFLTSEIFESVSEENQRMYSQRIKTFVYDKKQFIFREGFQPAGLYYIVRGKVKLFKSAFNGKEVIISIFKENEFMGYNYLMNNMDYKTSAGAVEETEIRFIPKRLFNEMILQYPAVNKKLIEMFFEDYDRLLDKLADVASKQVRKRVAEMLIRVMKKHGTEDDQKTLKIILSREDLAHLVATNTETLVRVFSEFKKDKLILLKGKRISILDAKRLAKVSSML